MGLISFNLPTSKLLLLIVTNSNLGILRFLLLSNEPSLEFEPL